MRISLILSAAALTLSPVLVSQAATAVETGTAATASTDADDKVICKARKRTGTRFTTKICKTVAQWDAQAEEHRRNIAEQVNRPIVNTERGN